MNLVRQPPSARTAGRADLTRLLPGIVVLIGMVFLFAGGLAYFHMSPPLPFSARNLAVSPSSLVRADALLYGDPAAPYKLVVFADYECAPCRQAEDRLTQLPSAYAGKIAVYHRNLPLTIHPRAFSAAIASENALIQGKFKAMHLLLVKGYLDQQTLDHNAQSLHIRAFDASAPQVLVERVKADQALASSLGIHQTPSFVLCTADGKAILLQSLPQIDALVR